MRSLLSSADAFRGVRRLVREVTWEIKGEKRVSPWEVDDGILMGDRRLISVLRSSDESL